MAVLPAATRADEARPVRIVVPAPPGGNLDLQARMLATRLSAATQDTYVVENRPGADTTIGSEFVARSAPDGRTLLIHGTGGVINAWTQKTRFSFMDELRPVALVSNSRFVLVSLADSPLDSILSLADAAGSRPQGLNCAAPPGPMALACEQLRVKFANKVTTVPYPGIGPALAALLGRHVDFMFANFEGVQALLDSGRLRALAATSALPNYHAMALAQVWPDLVMESFVGLFAQVGTPTDTVRRITRQVNEVLGDPAFVAALRAAGVEPATATTEQFEELVRRAHARYGVVVQRLGLARP